MRRRPPLPSPQEGLTLVEVAMALAITATVLTILAGTLGSTVRYAAEGFDRFAMARISQTLSDENRMLDWERLETAIDEGETVYFDERGNRLPSRTDDAIYAARLTLLDGPSLPGTTVTYPLRRLVIEVSSRGLAEDPFSGAHPIHRFSTLFTRMEADSSRPGSP